MSLMNVERELDKSATRNSSLRDFTVIADPGVAFLHQVFPKITAKQVTYTGVAFAGIGIAIATYQNITGKHNKIPTGIAAACSTFAEGCDLGDGKFARLIRSEMTDPEERERDEKVGQKDDPFSDGIKEALLCAACALTSKIKGDQFSFDSALMNLATTNLPRIARALVEFFGHSVPESYKFPDIRSFGVSSGRKAPNYIATFIHEFKGFPVGGWANSFAAFSNTIVTVDRLRRLIFSGEKDLSQKQIEHAGYRLLYLGGEGLLFGGAAYLAKRVFK